MIWGYHFFWKHPVGKGWRVCSSSVCWNSLTMMFHWRMVFPLFCADNFFLTWGGGVVPSNPKFAPILSLGVNLHMITKSFAFSKGVTNFARCKWSWLLFPQSKKWRKNVGYSDIPLLVLAGSSKIYSPAWVEQKSHCWQHSNLLNLLSYIRISSLKLTAKAPEIESWNTIVPKLGLQIFRGFCS